MIICVRVIASLDYALNNYIILTHLLANHS